MRHRHLIGLTLILMLLPLTISTPKVEAAYTYVSDPTYPEIGWMDVKRVGWDFNPNELLLYVQYQANIPNSPNYYFRGNFYLDTDRNPATGETGTGFDYYVYEGYLGDGSYRFCELWRWNPTLIRFEFFKPLHVPFGTPGGDAVEVGIPLSDIGSPTGIDICYRGSERVVDRVNQKYSYNTASEERSITVDGNPADWTGDTPDIADPTGDAVPSWADATKLYTTDGTGKLYVRIDAAATPLVLHPEVASSLGQYVYLYLDTDQDPSTGTSFGGIGADYYLEAYVSTTDTNRWVTFNVWKWSETTWTSVAATTAKAIGTCLELSVLLSDIGITGPKTMDIYIEELLHTVNVDLVPNSGKFTATKGPNPPARTLSEASTNILSATANSVYFIYANPYRMVSSTAAWQAAFAAYDATAAGFVYGLCANSQVICFDSNASIVVAKEPESNPPFNYGKVLLSSKRVVVVGGRGPNWVVDYYERTGQTPLKAYVGATEWGLQTQAGTVVASLPSSTDFTHNDLFVVMVFQDTNGNFVLIIYGLGWKGTFAGGIYFKEVIKPSLGTYSRSAYVFKWMDAGVMDGVPQAGEITKQYEGP